MSKQEINKDSLLAVLARMALNNPKLPTKEAAEARRILQSIKDTKALKSPYGADYYNTVLDTRVELNRSKPHGTTDIAFKTDGGYERPDVPNTRVRRLGINAQLNRAIDDLPTARDGTGRSAYYEATPMTDQKDYKKMSKTRSMDNQRAKLYRRVSKGAMDAVPDKYGNLSIQGERISDDTFQPRGEKGRLKKHVKWNLAEPVKRLDKIGQQMEPLSRGLSIVSNAANRANPYLLAADLIQQDIKKSTVNPGTLEGRNASELGFKGPPDPKPKSKSKLAIKAPPKKDTAVLSKKGGKTGSSVNGLFIAHPWSAEQRMRYAARSGK